MITPHGESGIWSFSSGASDYLANGRWEQATDHDDNYLYDENGDPVMVQVSPVPPPGSYVAVRTYTPTEWEPLVPELTEVANS